MTRALLGERLKQRLLDFRNPDRRPTDLDCCSVSIFPQTVSLSQRARKSGSAIEWARDVCGKPNIGPQLQCEKEPHDGFTDGTIVLDSSNRPTQLVLTPVNATVAVTELRPGSKVAAFLAEALKDAEPDLLTAAKNQIDPSVRAKARTEAANNASDWEVALGTLQNATTAYDNTLSDKSSTAAAIASARLALITAQTNYDKASRKL